MEPCKVTVKTSGGSRRRLSRYGCRNCKLRKLKCDEARPSCKRCLVFGVTCNFPHFNVPDLQSVQETPRSPTHRAVLPPRALVSNAVWSSNNSDYLTLDQQDQEMFCRFRFQTVPSLCDSDFVSVYEDTILKDSFTNPFLMHGLLAMAAVHGRYLGIQPTAKHSTREFSHSSQCTASFSKCLKEDIKEQQRDAIWATAVMLANIAFASLNISSHEDAWPLKMSDPSDLQWLRLKVSDKAL
ncbi:related to C6 finger domain protein [Rhynchosporium agropyri]|uniref:Related to C6 finger domain protein n=1 Tax=Rhynchosporium agropyri TaxID=914238 RepID=A0A1E1JR35_9HELO|nr:related to C6 finger domain protein [Rhynchosporium agropyri]